MPLDTRIISQIGQNVEPIKSPLEVYSKILGVQNQQQDQELGRQHIESNRATMERNARAEEQKAAAAQRDAEEDAAIQRSIIENGGDLTKAWDGIYKTVRPAKALEFRKSLDESRKAAATIAKDEVPVLEYQNGLKASVIQQALQLKPEEYAARWPEIAAAYNELDPESGVDPASPIEQGQLPFYLARVMAQTGILKERADREGLRQKVADADKAVADAKVASGTVDTRIAEQAGQAAQATVDPVTGLTRNQQVMVDDRREDNARQLAAQQIAERRAAETERHNQRMEERTNRILESGLSTQMNTAINSIANQFDNEPTVKRYSTIQEAAGFMNRLGTGKDATSTDDQGLIYAFAKAMDPDSVVREGEYKTVQQYAQAWAETYGFDAKRVFSNTPFLTEQARKQMKDTIAKKVAESKSSYDKTKEGYTKRIEAQTGAKDASRFLVDFDRSGSGSDGKIHVKAPDGSDHIFDTQAQADAFKKLANIK